MASDADKKLYKIGEVCRLADVQPYVLRYWETEFPQLAPSKSGGGQRLYNQKEVDVILRIKQLLYSEGFTIAGAKKKLEVEGTPVAATEPAIPAPTAQAAPAAVPDKRMKQLLTEMRSELTDILELLER
jgi:DNA-binding transcriptional MerR regulator